MGTIGLFAILVGMLYVLYKQSQEEKERRQQLLREKEEREHRAREEKERTLQELKLLSEMRSTTQVTKRIVSKKQFVGKCPSCGASIKDASLFCMYCGTDLSGNVQEHTEYIDTRTPLEKKIDMEYEEKMAKIKQQKREDLLAAAVLVIFFIILFGFMFGSSLIKK